MTLSGAFPVLCTPFDDAGAVDSDAFDRLIDFVLACQVQGCTFPGVASEVDTLSDQERLQLTQQLGGRLQSSGLPFIAGATADSVEGVRLHLQSGIDAGAAAAMVMAPLRLGDDIAAQTRFFEQATAGLALPIMLQNAPRPVGAGLSPEQLVDLIQVLPGIVYVKEETLPCGQHLSRILAGSPESMLGVFGGAGGRYIIDELSRGSLGTLPAAELSDVHARLVAAWARGDKAEAWRLYTISLPLLNFQAIFRMHMTKTTLMRRGVLSSAYVRGAGARMDEQDVEQLDIMLDQLRNELTVYPLTDLT